MAEAIAVVGVVAGVLEIIDGIEKYHKLWRTYFNTSTSLRKELLPVLGKMRALAGTLRGMQLQCELDEADADRLLTLQHIEQPLRACKEATQLIADRLEALSLSRSPMHFGKVLDKRTASAMHILDEAKPVLDLALAADQMTLNKAIETYVRNVSADIRDARLESKLYYMDLKETIHDIQVTQVDKSGRQDRADLLNWICDIDYTSNYHAAQQSAQQDDGSGAWFLDGSIFRDWMEATNKKVFLTGNSGCGKTILCAKAIKRLVRVKTTSGAKPSVLYFFFDFNDSAKTSMEGMVRCLLHQLLIKLGTVPAPVTQFYESQQVPEACKATLQDWSDLVRSILGLYQDTYIFIDALDECAEALATVLPIIVSLAPAECSTVSWLFTGRFSSTDPFISRSVSSDHVDLSAEYVDRDIESSLTVAFKTEPRLLTFSSDAAQVITSAICAKSHGMFRFARCQLDTIMKLRDRRMSKVKDVLSKMPSSLYEIYSQHLKNLTALDDWQIMRRILALVSFSVRPVSVAEVAEFAILEPEMTTITEDDRSDISDSLSMLSPLLAVRNSIVSLAHKTVQEFLSTDARISYARLSIPTDDAITTSSEIGLICLQYLRITQAPVSTISEARLTKEPNTPHLNKLIEQYRFLRYAATNWSYHYREQATYCVAAIAATLPLEAIPNLWHAWLFLQKADIWQNKLQLAVIIAGASVRAPLGWSAGSWQKRRAYRVRDYTRGKNEGIGSTLNTNEIIGGSQGSTAPDRGVSAVANLDFHDLSIVLLEIALQTDIFSQSSEILARIDSNDDLDRYQSHLAKLTESASEKMGIQYGDAVASCLSKVKWNPHLALPGRRLLPQYLELGITQDVCSPLWAMLKTGFRAYYTDRKRMRLAAQHTSHETPNWSAPCEANGRYKSQPVRSTGAYRASAPSHADRLAFSDGYAAAASLCRLSDPDTSAAYIDNRGSRRLRRDEARCLLREQDLNTVGHTEQELSDLWLTGQVPNVEGCMKSIEPIVHNLRPASQRDTMLEETADDDEEWMYWGKKGRACRNKASDSSSSRCRLTVTDRVVGVTRQLARPEPTYNTMPTELGADIVLPVVE